MTQLVVWYFFIHIYFNIVMFRYRVCEHK